MEIIKENPIKMDDLGGKKPIFGSTHVDVQQASSHFQVWDLRLAERLGMPTVLREGKKLPREAGTRVVFFPGWW